MAPRTDFPPVRACLFDMDGLLLDTEDLYTLCVNLILEKYQRPQLPWSIKAKLQGRPGPAANKLFHDWAELPITHEEYVEQYYALQAQHFPNTQPLPGIPELLSCLGRTRYWDLKKGQPQTNGHAAATNGHATNGHTNGINSHKPNGATTTPAPHRVHIALATSSHASNFRLKTAHLTSLFSVFPSHRRVLGDDARIPPGRGKPLPDIYLVALKTINDSLPEGETPITPEECLVFEDSVPGVEAGRRAGMRVVWCPHPMLKKEYSGREGEVLAARTGEAGEVDLHQLGEVDDGWAEYLPTLVEFPYERYGVVVPPVEVEQEEGMVEGGVVGEGEVLQAV
ncbi:HAD-like domain-containing protein [Staphylotrichum tortipilum]|uniref:HAD-like domain-containing protein n=1 Tax=Staphylotrichum tortipilum TaxID=2831512 RepID=A0AAN6MVZ0_9PEZI|nr:HAD-like domain-containing protein [Staphylotrichum longicolle]